MDVLIHWPGRQRKTLNLHCSSFFSVDTVEKVKDLYQDVDSVMPCHGGKRVICHTGLSLMQAEVLQDVYSE